MGKRLEKLFGQPGLKVEDLVIAVGEEEVEKEVKKLQEDVKKWDDEVNESLTVRELEKEIDDLVNEIHKLRDDNATGIDIERENLGLMLKDITGHNEKLERDLKDLTEDLERAREDEKKLKEELNIAKNEAVSLRQESQSDSWSQLRNGKGAGNMAQMMRNK